MPKNKYKDLIDLVKSGEDDAIKFYEKGNATAGTRVRNLIQEIKKLAQEVRLDIQEIKNKGKKK